jgi:hypothetical protein
MSSRPRLLSNGAPTIRLQFLAGRLYDLGPRPLYELLKELVERDGIDLVASLEGYARLDPSIVQALRGRDLRPGVHYVTRTFPRRLKPRRPRARTSESTTEKSDAPVAALRICANDEVGS